MNAKRKDTETQQSAHYIVQEETSTEHEHCACLPISHLYTHITAAQSQSLTAKTSLAENAGIQTSDTDDYNQLVPVTERLNQEVRSRLKDLFPRTEPLSVLLLHISQLEHTHISPQAAVLYRRHRYHATDTLLEQFMVNVRRAIRGDDQMVIDAGRGAAVIFPNVDQQGAYTILERIYHSVSLLQAETIIPPLTRETDIVMGMGTYPKPEQSLEYLLANAGRIAYRLTLRPAITTHLWDTMPASDRATTQHTSNGHGNHTPMTQQADEQVSQNTAPDLSNIVHLSVNADKPLDAHSAIQVPAPVPFLRLPTQLPRRLKSLIPYKFALQFHCAPVGRDHHCITVAMADPTNDDTIHRLQELTGMTIFPVSCEIDALDTLLKTSW